MSTTYSNHILVDWAFAVQAGVIDVVQKSFPSELSKWPLSKAFDSRGYIWNKRYLVVVLVDKFTQFPRIGAVEIFPFDAYLDPPSLKNIRDWQDFLWSKLSLRTQDFVVIVPYTEGKSIEERWSKLSDEEKELWRKQIQFGVVRNLNYIRGISATTKGDTSRKRKNKPPDRNDMFLDLLEKDLKDDESQSTEWKRTFPPYSKDLADNIASFATSNKGVIYVGIEKDGTFSNIDPLQGLTRDEARRKITGIAKSVKPSVIPRIDFIEKDSKNVIRVEVPKGAEPVYYRDNIPYVRDNSQSRPATPDEVEALMQKHFRRREEAEEKKIPVLRYDGIRKDSSNKYYLKINKEGQGLAIDCYGSIDIEGEETLHNFPLYWRNISECNSKKGRIGNKEYLCLFQIVDYSGRTELTFIDFGAEGKYVPQRKLLSEVSKKKARIEISSGNARIPRSLVQQIDKLIDSATPF